MRSALTLKPRRTPARPITQPGLAWSPTRSILRHKTRLAADNGEAGEVGRRDLILSSIHIPSSAAARLPRVPSRLLPPSAKVACSAGGSRGGRRFRFLLVRGGASWSLG